MVVSLHTVATNEVVEISLPLVASLLPVVSLPTVAAETLLAVSLPTVATNKIAEISLPPVASLLPVVSLSTVAAETLLAIRLPTVATDSHSQSTTIATTSSSARNSSNEGPRALTVSDSLIDNCDSETRIDHQVDDDDKRASPNSIRTINDLDSSSSSDGGSSESSQSNDKSRKRSRSPSDDGRGNSKKPTSQRSDNNRDVVRKGCVALHYSVHFFYDFSLSRNDRNRGGGYRRKICMVPTPFFLCLPDPLEKMRDSNSGPCVWIPLALPLNHI